MNFFELDGFGFSNWWIVLLAAVVVTVISCALSYVSTFLGVSALSGLAAQLSGPINADVVYPEAEATLNTASEAVAPAT